MRLPPSATAILLASALPLAAQGPLQPPGGPAPTMKTLDQVEARIAINATTTPGNDDYHFVITQPGSYYLTGNLAVTKKHGISVSAARVTIDLNGFEIARTAGSAGDGITVSGGNCFIKNGALSGFNNGISAFNADSGMAERLRVSGCSTGVSAGSGWVLDHIVARGNQNGIGTSLAPTVSNCTSVANSGNGFLIGVGGRITNSIASQNGSAGIFLFDGATAERCSARLNGSGIVALERGTVRNCEVEENGGSSNGSGIVGSIRSVIKDNSSKRNQLHGIDVSGDSVVSGNHVSDNGRGGNANAAGIRLTGAGSRLEGNHVRDNAGTGIVAGAADIVIRNTAGGNSGLNYNVPGNSTNFGPLQPVNNTTNPNANHVF